MLNRLAIIIVGEQNSGKTTTLRNYHDIYNHDIPQTFKQGWRHNFHPFKNTYWAVKVDAYFLPSSRTEKDVSLEEVLDAYEWFPPFLFMAEQLNGSQYDNTIRYLRTHEYHIKEFRTTNDNEDSLWHLYNKADEAMIQKLRSEQIADYVRNYILHRI